VSAWECVGCGRIEGPQPCLGVCQDRKREFVYAEDYDVLAARLEKLEAIVRQIATVKPRAGECERTFLALKGRARTALTG
jgi:hypothetical protein